MRILERRVAPQVHREAHGNQAAELILAHENESADRLFQRVLDASQVRSKATDVVDIWRCLEVAFTAGIDAGEFAKGPTAKGAAVVRSLFAERDGPGMTALIGEQRLSPRGADQRFTRLRALIARVLDAR